jgi:2,3-bisphosphoglycerate-independent phosphoglycerate mutase
MGKQQPDVKRIETETSNLNMKKPVVLVIMDGVGIGKHDMGDAVFNANTPTLNWLMENCPHTKIKAHGTAVGLPSDEDMGNSEVGHNALGCGQIYSQGAMLVNESIADGSIFKSETWNSLVSNCVAANSTLHFIGLLSDGNVHSNINHLKAMIREAKLQHVSRVRVHILLDGRDVPSTSALQYVEDLEAAMSALNDASFDARIASGGGRMKVTMDRYQADWNMVKTGWETHVLGLGRQFASAADAIETYRKELDVIDQDLPAFVIAENGKPVGTIEDHDSVIFFNFRGDRAIEISMAFDYPDFDKFDRVRYPQVKFAGMLQYDGDLKLPEKFLVSPPNIQHTLSELLVENNIRQFAISETQKFGHVTYFWNGNRSGKTSETLETFEEIPSDNVPFSERPWMKSAEITDRLIEVINSGQYDFIRCNYPNGDMVGHTGNYDATLIGVETVDLALARLLKDLENHDFTLVITADHGNADDMIEKTKSGKVQSKTAHSLNPVPFIIFDKETNWTIREGDFGLANVTPTLAKLMGLTPPAAWVEPMI